MALSLSTNPVAFRGLTSGCVLVSLLMHQFPFQVQLSGSSAFDCLFDSNGCLSVCPFGSNGHLPSCGIALAVCSLDPKDDVLWPQSACSVSSFLAAAVFHS